MKLALIAGGLFLLSYLLVNKGLGPQPLALLAPLLVVLATSFAAGRMLGRRRKPRPDTVFDAPLERRVPPQPLPPMPPAAPRPPRSKARKLF